MVTARRALFAYLMVKAGNYTPKEASYYVRIVHDHAVKMLFHWIAGPIDIMVP